MASNKTITISRLDSGKKGKDQEVLFESAGRSVESSDVISQSSMNTSRQDIKKLQEKLAKVSPRRNIKTSPRNYRSGDSLRPILEAMMK